MIPGQAPTCQADLLCVQHEFAIFGGPFGAQLINLLRRLRQPLVTTLYTLLQSPRQDLCGVKDDLVRGCGALVVMRERGRSILEAVCGVDPAQINGTPLGFLDLPFVDPNFHKDQSGVAGR